MKTIEEILLNTTRCTITEEADLDVNENFYFAWNDVISAMKEYAKQFQPKAENIETYPKEFVIWLLSDNGPLKDKESSLLKTDKNLYYDINEVLGYWVAKYKKITI